MKEGLKKILGCIIGIIFVGALIAIGMKIQKGHNDKYPWKGAFYKDIDGSVTDSKDFKSLFDCRGWAFDLGKDLEKDKWKFSCGTGCKYNDETIVSGKRVKTYNCTELVTE